MSCLIYREKKKKCLKKKIVYFSFNSLIPLMMMDEIQGGKNLWHVKSIISLWERHFFCMSWPTKRFGWLSTWSKQWLDLLHERKKINIFVFLWNKLFRMGLVAIWDSNVNSQMDEFFFIFGSVCKRNQLKSIW